MNEVKATAMATAAASKFGISRAAAFDLILATAQQLEVGGTSFSAKTAVEIEAVMARDVRSGNTAKLARRAIGA